MIQKRWTKRKKHNTSKHEGNEWVGFVKGIKHFWGLHINCLTVIASHVPFSRTYYFSWSAVRLNKIDLAVSARSERRSGSRVTTGHKARRGTYPPTRPPALLAVSGGPHFGDPCNWFQNLNFLANVFSSWLSTSCFARHDLWLWIDLACAIIFAYAMTLTYNQGCGGGGVGLEAGDDW